MSKARIVLSFDDGRMDNYKVVFSILKRRKIPATFNIATAYVDGSISLDDSPCTNNSMTIENVIDLEKSGFEIAGHGDCHQNTLEDIQSGLTKLRDWLHYPHNQMIGLASPNSNLKECNILARKKEFENIAVSYVRTGSRNSSLYMRAVRKLAHLTKNTYLYKKGFQDSLEADADQFVFHSIPVMNKATVEQVKTIVKEAAHQKKICILMFHSILDDDSSYFNDTWSWDRKKFEELCGWLAVNSIENRISLSTLRDLVEKGK